MEHEHRLTVVEDRSQSNMRRIEDLEKRADNQDKLISTVSVLAAEQKTIKSDVSEIKSDIKTIASKPAKKWDSLVEKIFLTVAAALVGFLLSKLGIGG